MFPEKFVRRNVKIFTGAKFAVVDLHNPAMEQQDLGEEQKERIETGDKELNQKKYIMAVLLVK